MRNKIMKLKLKELKANPFKKHINNGKLDEETVKKIQSNMKELGLMGSLPIFKKEDKYFLIAGHHRVEALKRTFGKDYEIPVDVKQYSEDNILRGMVVENLTQRDNEAREVMENLTTIKKHIIKNKILLDDEGSTVQRADSTRISSRGRTNEGQPPELGSIRQISLWLDKNTGDVMKRSQIAGYLQIAENLNEELLENVKKVKGSAIENETNDVLPVRDALVIASIKDKEEQKEIAKLIIDSNVDSGADRRKMISQYKNAPEDIKEKVLTGDLSLSEVEMETFKQKNKEAYDEVQKSKDEGIKVVRTAEILQSVREEISNTTRELDRFFYKVKAVKFARLSWGNKREQKDFKVFVNNSLNKAKLWVTTLEKIKEEVDYEN